MITSLTIRRFKSIQSLELPCRKVNVFIGPPDTGKTNILEALALLSRLGWGLPLGESLRLDKALGFGALFHRQLFDRPFEIGFVTPEDSHRLTARAVVQATLPGIEPKDRGVQALGLDTPWASVQLAFGGRQTIPELRAFRSYAYSSSKHWGYAPAGDGAWVLPSQGRNLMYVARHHQRVYDFLKDLIAAGGWKLHFHQGATTFYMSEVRGDDIVDYNLDLLSDSLKRFFFYGAILRTSENATLVFDEPDVFAFPPYPKTLGEMIGQDETNQFFVTTHNPYFLAGVLAKTKLDDLALFVCQRDDDGDTAARLLDGEQVAEAIEQDADVFFNLEAFVSR